MAVSVATQMLADQAYRQSTTKIKETYLHQPVERKVAFKRVPSEKSSTIKERTEKTPPVGLTPIEEQICKILRKNGPMKAQTLAVFLKEDKTQVNSILYNGLQPRGIATQTNYFWSLND